MLTLDEEDSARKIYSLISQARYLERLPERKPVQEYQIQALWWVVNLLESGDYSREVAVAVEWADDWDRTKGRRR